MKSRYQLSKQMLTPWVPTSSAYSIIRSRSSLHPLSRRPQDPHNHSSNFNSSCFLTTSSSPSIQSSQPRGPKRLSPHRTGNRSILLSCSNRSNPGLGVNSSRSSNSTDLQDSNHNNSIAIKLSSSSDPRPSSALNNPSQRLGLTIQHINTNTSSSRTPCPACCP